MCVLCLVAQSCLTLYDTKDCSLPGSSVHGDSPGKNTGVGAFLVAQMVKSTGVGCDALPQVIFPTQGLNPGLPHCTQILYRLNHQGDAKANVV